MCSLGKMDIKIAFNFIKLAKVWASLESIRSALPYYCIPECLSLWSFRFQDYKKPGNTDKIMIKPGENLNRSTGPPPFQIFDQS